MELFIIIGMVVFAAACYYVFLVDKKVDQLAESTLTELEKPESTEVVEETSDTAVVEKPKRTRKKTTTQEEKPSSPKPKKPRSKKPNMKVAK